MRLDYVAVPIASAAGPWGCPRNSEPTVCGLGHPHRHLVMAWLRRGQPIPLCFLHGIRLEPTETTAQETTDDD